MSAKEAYLSAIKDIADKRPAYLLTQIVLVLGIFAAVFAAATFAIRVREGLRWFENPDELEQFVVAQMLIRGSHLYRDIFSHHGPLTYMIAHFYAFAVSQSDFSYIRISQAIFALMSCAATMFCPVLRTTSGRIWVGAIYLLLLSSVWNMEGLNQLTYYALSQLLFVILVTQFVVPKILGGRQSRYGSFAAGVAGGLAFFCAYSNSVAVLLFVLPSLPLVFLRSDPSNQAHRVKALGFGVMLAATAIGLWILKFGDLTGYFVYHFYFNQLVYAPYIHFSTFDFLRNFSFSFAPQQIIHGFALALFFCWLYIFTILQKEADSAENLAPKLITLLVTVVGVLFTNPRGELGVYDQGFVAINFALFALGCGVLLEKGIVGLSTRPVLNTMLLCATVLALASEVDAYAIASDIPKKDFSKSQGTMKPAEGALYAFVRQITKKEGDLLALNYGANVYFKADRLPASGNLFYLPWQAAYNRNPKYGYKIDICADIKARTPAVIWFFNWRVWEKYSLDDYEPCVLSLIIDGYTPLRFDSPWYIRNDLFHTASAMVPPDAVIPFDFFGFAPKILRVSAPLESFSPIEIMMSPTHREHHVALRRMGVMIRTYGGQARGEAELHLKGSDGAGFSQRFLLSDVPDNRYYYFDVDFKWYTVGEIRSLSGGGISTWESHLVDEPYTCVIYEYVDHTTRYTPACPIM